MAETPIILTDQIVPLAALGAARGVLIPPPDLPAALVTGGSALSGESSQARLQEPTLGGLARQLKGAFVGGPRRLGEAAPALHLGARGVGQVITVEAALPEHRLDSRQPGLGPVAHAEGGCAVQGHHRRGVAAEQHIVERDDLGPVGLAGGRCLGVNRRDGRLQDVRSDAVES